jgi:DNA excision repair protein ERCC-4
VRAGRKLYDSRGREKLESKADLASRGVESPDRADALIGAVMGGIGSDPYALNPRAHQAYLEMMQELTSRTSRIHGGWNGSNSEGVSPPALRSLGELADRSPVILIDTREQEPQVFERLASIRGTLTTGDYSVAGLQDHFSIERKTVSDLVGCCMDENRERFERELHRLRGYRFKRLLVGGSEAEILAGNYHSRITPKAVLATLCAFEVRYDLPVVFVPTAQVGARLV